MTENRNILVVSDDFSRFDAHKTFLQERFSVSITEANSGKKALKILREWAPTGDRIALLIVDLDLKGSTSSLQLIEQAWQVDPCLQILLTATDRTGSVISDLDLVIGSDQQDQWNLLYSPVSVDEFVQKIRHTVVDWNRRERERLNLKTIHDQQQAIVAQDRLSTVGKFSRAIGHELGNILQQAMTKLELAPKNELTDEALEAIELGSSLCRDLLTFARHENKPVDRVELDLVNPISKAARLMRHALKVKDITLEINVPSNFRVLCQEAPLTQVFINLISNSVHAMKDGGKIAVSAKVTSSNEVCISVADSGSGIAPEHLARVFEPLYSGVKYRNGLGLTICKSIIENNGGSITPESTIGKGTTMFIKFPLLKQ